MAYFDDGLNDDNYNTNSSDVIKSLYDLQRTTSTWSSQSDFAGFQEYLRETGVDKMINAFAGQDANAIAGIPAQLAALSSQVSNFSAFINQNLKPSFTIDQIPSVISFTYHADTGTYSSDYNGPAGATIILGGKYYLDKQFAGTDLQTPPDAMVEPQAIVLDPIGRFIGFKKITISKPAPSKFIAPGGAIISAATNMFAGDDTNYNITLQRFTNSSGKFIYAFVALAKSDGSIHEPGVLDNWIITATQGAYPGAPSSLVYKDYPNRSLTISNQPVTLQNPDPMNGGDSTTSFKVNQRFQTSSLDLSAYIGLSNSVHGPLLTFSDGSQLLIPVDGDVEALPAAS